MKLQEKVEEKIHPYQASFCLDGDEGGLLIRISIVLLPLWIVRDDLSVSFTVLLV